MPTASGQRQAGCEERLLFDAEQQISDTCHHTSPTRAPLHLPAALVNTARRNAERANGELGDVLLAALWALLHRYTGRTEITVRTSTASLKSLCERVEAQGAVRSLPDAHGPRWACASLGGDFSFDELVRAAVRRTSGEGDRAVQLDMLQLRDDRSSPRFCVTLSLQADKTAAPVWTAPPSAALEDCGAELLFELFAESAGELVGSIACSEPPVDAWALSRMAHHYGVLLRQALAAPLSPVSRLPLASAAERHQVVADWSARRADYGADTCVHHLIEGVVERTPQSTAVVAGAQRLTYAELNQLSNQLAHYLRKRGVGPDVCVGVCMEPCVKRIVAVLGVLKAGGAYVPMDPSYPPDRLAAIWDDLDSQLLVTQRQLVDRLPFTAGGDSCVHVDDWARFASQPTSNPEVEMTPDHLAYVIFTSGSTGRPKGILLEHRGLCNLIHASNELFDMRESSRVLQLSAFGFDVAVWETFMALVAGATLCHGERSLAGLKDLPKLLRDQEITMALLPPSLLAVLPASGLPQLETVIAVGERCTNGNVARWAPGRKFFNGYGPAEGSVTATAYLTDHREPPRPLGPPIGKPLPNVEVYVLDPDLQPVPVGVPGELYLGGVCVARGYLNRPQLTRACFVPHPFDSTDKARLYKTGDLARYLPGGDLEFLGRVDHQIKIRGHRVELGEIEAVLVGLAGVESAVVTVRDDRPAGQYLAAYIVPRREVPVRVDDLRRSLEEKVPAYMVPSVFVQLDSLPLTPNGKVDRKGLPAPDREGRGSAGSDTPAWLRQLVGGDRRP